jgi:hypothetical protein
MTKSCSYCGKSSGEINFDIFTEKYYCDNAECIKKAQKDTKAYFKERAKKINREFKITDVSTQEDLEDILYALFGILERAGKTADLGPMSEPDFFKNRALYLIASELPENLVSIRMGKKDKTKVELKIWQTIPASKIKEAMQKAGFI